MSSYGIVGLAAFLGWIGGMLMGRWGEANLWRQAAKNGRLKESNGFLFEVTEGVGRQHSAHWN